MKSETDQRLASIMEVIGSMARMDFTVRAVTNESYDTLDVIGQGLNMLSEEFEDNVVEREAYRIRNEELERFSYIVSHDLKAPLRGIMGLAQWIEEDLEDCAKESILENLAMLKARVQRMDILIEDILKYSKIGMQDVDYEDVELSTLIDEVGEALSVPDEYQLIVHNAPKSIRMRKILMFQLFSNLIDNSVKYNDKPHGKTEITYRKIGGMHTYTVSDNGPGIHPEHQSKIFDIFETLGRPSSKESTGIGLSIVKKIVDLENGSVHVESDVGKGTTFSVMVENR